MSSQGLGSSQHGDICKTLSWPNQHWKNGTRWLLLVGRHILQTAIFTPVWSCFFVLFGGHAQWCTGLNPGSAIREFSWQCSWDHIGYKGWNLSCLQARQAPFLLYYFSGPGFAFLTPSPLFRRLKAQSFKMFKLFGSALMYTYNLIVNLRESFHCISHPGSSQVLFLLASLRGIQLALCYLSPAQSPVRKI